MAPHARETSVPRKKKLTQNRVIKRQPRNAPIPTPNRSGPRGQSIIPRVERARPGPDEPKLTEKKNQFLLIVFFSQRGTAQKISAIENEKSPTGGAVVKRDDLQKPTD